MKTSNYIIISFLVFLFGGIFVLFLDAKIKYPDSQRSPLLSVEKALDNFSVVVAEQGAGFTLRSGEQSKICCLYQKGDSCRLPQYLVRNDTLFVFRCPDKEKRWATQVYCKYLKSIVGNNESNITVEEFRADTLLVNLNKADFFSLGNITNSEISKITVMAVKSQINLHDSKIDNLDIQLNDTKIHAWNNEIASLSGSLTNDSYISLQRLSKINLEVDQTSAYQINK